MHPVTVVVVTYQDKAAVSRCLESLQASTLTPAEIIVVDNGSTDGTVAAIAAAFPQVRIIANPTNSLLAEARNIGVRAAQTGFVFLVDNDNVVAPTALAELVTVIQTDPQIALVGPVAYFLTAPNRIWSAGSVHNMLTSQCTHLQTLPPDGQPVTVDCFPNAFMVRRAAALAVGLFDSRGYASEFHESDFGLRLKRAGYRALLAPKAAVYHDLPISTDAGSLLRRLHFGGAADAGRNKAYYLGRNRLIFMRDHAGPNFWPFLLIFFPATVLVYSALVVVNRRWDLLRAYWRGVGDGVKRVRGN